MRSIGTGGKRLLLGSLIALSLPMTAVSAHVAKPLHVTARSATAGSHGQVHGASKTASRHLLKGRRYARGGGIQCVAYARNASGIVLSGNASNWWDNAAGLYARGSAPEAGSVLSFTANGRMRLGHVAVVTNVISGREIEIDHANWSGPGARRGGVSRGILVVDVSDNNDWTAVRVALGHSGEFGSIYPTHGFIYPRPDQGGELQASAEVLPAPVLNPPPRDLRPASARSRSYDEVAEAPANHALTLTYGTGWSDTVASPTSR